MKSFFLIVFFVYLLINIYVFSKGWQALPQLFTWRLVYSILFLIASSSFILSMLLRDDLSLGLLKIIYAIGTIWLAFMLYSLLFYLFTDLIQLFNRIFHFFPENVTLHFRQIQVILCSVVVIILLIIGYVRFNNPVVETFGLKIAKKAGTRKELRIVAISDVHLGLLIDKGRLQNYVKKINALQPDIIFIAGDIVDNSVRPLNEEHLEEELNSLEAPLGVYASLGNHEYLSGIDKSLEFLRKTKINLLIDQTAYIDSSFWIIGRDDRSNQRRHSLKNLLTEVDVAQPVFLIDHQPYYLEDAQKNGIDFQLSGHTHNGQLWPGNLIVRKIYEVGYGYKLKDNTHYYVSSGLALWGPMFRLGTQSEIVVFNIQFE